MQSLSLPFRKISSKMAAGVCSKLSYHLCYSIYQVCSVCLCSYIQVRSWFQDKQSTLTAKAIPSFSPEETLASPRALPVKRRGKGCLLLLQNI